MRFPQKLALLWAMLPLIGCRSRYTVPEQPMPPNTILLSQMMRELSAHPGFTEGLLKELEGAKAGKRGPALLTPDLIDELRKRILGKDWQGLDRFPGWTMREINPVVRVASHVAGKSGKLEAISAVHPGAPAQLSKEQARVFLDLGPYSLDEAQTISLDEPSRLPAFSTEGIVTPIGMGVTRGDGPNSLAPEHADSQRLADVLNRLSVNRMDGAEPFLVRRPWTAAVAEAQAYPGPHDKPNLLTSTPEDLIQDLIATGHRVTVTDSRYFANFGHLHYKGMDVMMPFWVNTQIAIPGSGGLLHKARPLLVPVSHAEYEWHIRGPHINADISHYFGIDGKAEWRTMDTLDQAWVLKRNAHTYTGPDAVEVTRLTGLMTLAYMHQHAKRPTLPFGGYYSLGVCQDPVSAIEMKITGHSTLFPNTVESALFDDPRDAEVNALMHAIPKDRAGEEPQPERIFGSLPAEPGRDSSFRAVAIPGLADDLRLSFAAWHEGRLNRTHGRLFYAAAISATSVLALAIIGFAVLAWKRREV